MDIRGGGLYVEDDLEGDGTIFGALTGNVTGSATDLNCTDCINATEIEDIYVLNSGDTITGTLTVGDTNDDLLVADGYLEVCDGGTGCAVAPVDGSLFVETKATTTVALWVGSAGTAHYIDITGGDLYVQDDVEIDDDLYVTGDVFVTSTVTITGAAMFDAGIVIDDDNVYPTPSAGSLIVGDGSDTGTFEVEDASACIGDGGCTAPALDGTLLLESNLVLGTAKDKTTNVGGINASSTVTGENWLTASSSSITTGDFVKWVVPTAATFTGDILRILNDSASALFRIGPTGKAPSTVAIWIGTATTANNQYNTGSDF